MRLSYCIEGLESRVLLSATAPKIVSQIFDNRGLAVLTLERAVYAPTVTAANCKLFTAGTDGILGTGDDVDQGAVVSYNATARTISLKKTLPANTAYRIRITGGAIRGLDSVALDGEFNSMTAPSGDGTAGGTYDVVTSTTSQPTARFATRYGTIYTRLFNDGTPLTVANFLSYANSGAWDGTIIHRSEPNFVIQGGGFNIDGTNQIDQIAENAAVQNEPGFSNTRGWIAMAKQDGDPNSATNQWFFNVQNNAANLDFQNGGFTAFGLITDDAGLAVMDTINQLARVNGGSPFDALPVNDLAAVQARGEIDPQSDAVLVNRLSILMNAKPTVPVQIAGVGDFNADGKPDIVIRNFATGDNTIWLMNGGAKIGEAALPAARDLNWRIQAVADFNRDGKQDIVLRNYLTGGVKIWIMNGTTRTSVVDLSLTDLNWQIAGAADLTQDGKTDIIWRNYYTGANQVWRMDGTALLGTVALASQADSNERLGAVADFYKDGQQDLVFHNYATGANTVWAMWGSTRMGIIPVMPPQTDASSYLVGKGDFNVDKKPDLVWRNLTTGANEVWLMNGVNRLSILALPTA